MIGQTRYSEIPTNLEDTAFDLVVIGAGINGTGIARDAAMRGSKKISASVWANVKLPKFLSIGRWLHFRGTRSSEKHGSGSTIVKRQSRNHLPNLCIKFTMFVV